MAKLGDERRTTLVKSLTSGRDLFGLLWLECAEKKHTSDMTFTTLGCPQDMKQSLRLQKIDYWVTDLHADKIVFSLIEMRYSS